MAISTPPLRVSLSRSSATTSRAQPACARRACQVAAQRSSQPVRLATRPCQTRRGDPAAAGAERGGARTQRRPGGGLPRPPTEGGAPRTRSHGQDPQEVPGVVIGEPRRGRCRRRWDTHSARDRSAAVLGHSAGRAAGSLGLRPRVGAGTQLELEPEPKKREPEPCRCRSRCWCWCWCW